MSREQFVTLFFMLVSTLFIAAFGFDLVGTPVSTPVMNAVRYFSLMISLVFLIINVSLWVQKEDIPPPNCVFLAISATTFCWSVGWIS